MKLGLENSNVKNFPYRIYWETAEVGVSLVNAISTISPGFSIPEGRNNIIITKIEKDFIESLGIFESIIMELRLESNFNGNSDFPYTVRWKTNNAGIALENAIKTITTGFCLDTSSTYLPVTIAERDFLESLGIFEFKTL